MTTIKLYGHGRYRKFWMVKGLGAAQFRHDTQDQAEAEAARLARRNPGQEFYVLEAIAVHRLADVERVSLCDDERPF